MSYMIEAEIGAFETAASGFTGVAEGMRAADVATPFTEVQSALPETETFQAAVWLGSRLAAAVQVFADDVESLGELSSATGSNYQGVDLDQQTRFGQVPVR